MTDNTRSMCWGNFLTSLQALLSIWSQCGLCQSIQRPSSRITEWTTFLCL